MDNKKTYEKPYAEKLEFEYGQQVVACSNCETTTSWTRAKYTCGCYIRYCTVNK